MVGIESKATNAEVSTWFHVTFLCHLWTNVTFVGMGASRTRSEFEGSLSALQSMYEILKMQFWMEKCIYIICYSFKVLLCLRGFNSLKRMNCFQEWGLPDIVKGCLSARVCSSCCQVHCILYVDHHCKYGSKNCSFQYVWSMYIFTAEFAVICWKLYGAELLVPPFWCEYSRSFAYLGVWTCASVAVTYWIDCLGCGADVWHFTGSVS